MNQVVRRMLVIVAALVLCLLALAPLYWVLITSLKPETDVLSYPPAFVPKRVTGAAYLAVFARPAFLKAIVNSLVFSAGSAVLTLLAALPSGYAFARLRFRGRHSMLLVLLATNMIPGVALIVPLYYLFDRAQLVDNYAALILVYAAQYVPQAIWFMKNFIETVPVELEEAAMADGCSRFRAMTTVIAPLIAPGIAALAILGFITVWNDYVMIASLTRDPSMQSVQVQLVNQLFEAIGASWSSIAVYITLASFPILALFLLVQRWFIQGLTAGALKG